MRLLADLPLDLDVGAIAVGASESLPVVSAHVDDVGTSTVSNDSLLGDAVGASDVNGHSAQLVVLGSAELVHDRGGQSDELLAVGAGELRGEVGGQTAAAGLVEDLVARGIVGEGVDGASDGHVSVVGAWDVALLERRRSGGDLGGEGDGRDGDSRSELHFGLLFWF
jgi:hypothetical protein